MGPKTKIYLAGSFASRKRLRMVRDELTRLGFEITSRWLDEPTEKPSGMSEYEWHESIARRDLADVNSASVVMVDTLYPSTKGGSHAEFGYSLAMNKIVTIVGPYRNVFHTQAHRHYLSWEEVFDALYSPRKSRAD